METLVAELLLDFLCMEETAENQQNQLILPLFRTILAEIEGTAAAGSRERTLKIAAFVLDCLILK